MENIFIIAVKIKKDEIPEGISSLHIQTLRTLLHLTDNLRAVQNSLLVLRQHRPRSFGQRFL